MIHIAGLLSEEVASIYTKLLMHVILSFHSIFEKISCYLFKNIFEILILSNVISL